MPRSALHFRCPVGAATGSSSTSYPRPPSSRADRPSMKRQRGSEIAQQPITRSGGRQLAALGLLPALLSRGNSVSPIVMSCCTGRVSRRHNDHCRRSAPSPALGLRSMCAAEDGLHGTLELVQQRRSQPLQHLHRHRLPSQAPGVELRAPATHGLSLGSTAIAVSALASWRVSYGLVRNLKYGSCLKRSWRGVST